MATISDIWSEYYSALDGEYEENPSEEKVAGYLLNAIDLLVSVGCLDKHKIQNFKLEARVKFVERFGFPEGIINPIPNYEKPVDPYAQ